MKKPFLSFNIKTKSGKLYNLVGNGEKMYMTFNTDGFPCTYRLEGYSPLAVGQNLRVRYYALTCRGTLQKYEFDSNEPIVDMVCRKA